jgi:hypothetical protein
MFDGQTTNADFVIRGVGKGSEAPKGYFDLCKKAGYEECEKYSDLPLVPRNSPIKIKFFVEQDSGSGSVGWAGDSVQLFYPQFALGYQKISCGSSPIPNTCEKSVTPMRPLFTYTDPSGSITSEVVPGSAVRCMKSLPAGVYLSQKDALAQLQSGYTMGAQELEPTSFWARVSGVAPECAGETKSYTCSDGGTEFLKGCEKPLSYSEDQLLSKCAVRDFVKGRDRIVLESSSEKMMPEGERRLGCTGIQYPACAQPFVSSTGEKYLLSSDNSSCSVAVQHACARWDPPPYFDLDSDPKCPDIQAELIKEYRQRCDQLPQDVDVVVTKKVEEPFVASQAPVDRCQKVSQRPAVEVECAYMAPYPVAQACCRDNTSGCHIETLGGAGSVTTTSSPSQRQSLAVARAQEAIVTVYPRARFRGGAHCLPDEKHCADVQVTSLEHDTRASMSASMQVPVVMLGWLGLGSLSQVSYSEDRVLESSLIR